MPVFVDMVTQNNNKTSTLNLLKNSCRYLDENIRTYIRNPPTKLKEDETFIESNKMHGEINIHTNKMNRIASSHDIPSMCVLFLSMQPSMVMCMGICMD